jgi:hypothetical protein
MRTSRRFARPEPPPRAGIAQKPHLVDVATAITVDGLHGTQPMADQLRRCLTTDPHAGEHGVDVIPDIAQVKPLGLQGGSDLDMPLAARGFSHHRATCRHPERQAWQSRPVGVAGLRLVNLLLSAFDQLRPQCRAFRCERDQMRSRFAMFAFGIPES